MSEMVQDENRTGMASSAFLRQLALSHDLEDNALSVYFSLPKEVVASPVTRQMISEQFFEKLSKALQRSNFISNDVMRAFHESVVSHPDHFHYLLNVGTQIISRCLPVNAPSNIVETGYRVNLFPLLCAMELCATFAVMLLEADRARLFLGHGDAVEEMLDILPVADRKTHSDDSRVGWSHHVEGNAAHRSDAYWSLLAKKAKIWLDDFCPHYLVIGCREDLWGHSSRHFKPLGRGRAVGFFHLPNFED